MADRKGAGLISGSSAAVHKANSIEFLTHSPQDGSIRLYSSRVL